MANKKQTLEKLCSIVSHIGETVFNGECVHDCFCSFETCSVGNEILNFLQEAVGEKIVKGK